ncbi:MAG TPA: phosphatase PAP2 family protein [Polyangiaceae bacterium]|nr:phosphatase PAP2 family protein [Polyangiaceae bacterium]
MNCRARIATGCITLALGVGWATDVRAQAAEFGWDPRWPKFRPSEYVLTGVTGSAALVLYFGVRDARTPRLNGGILFDDYFRDGLRLRGPAARDLARTISDWTALSAMTWVIAVDSLTVPLARGSTELSGQMLLMDAEAYSISTLLTTLIFKSIARARPSYADCERDPNYDPLCKLHPTGSFPSGHTNTAFTAAGLSCAHHLNVPLYGNKVADALACVGTLTLATATGTLRIAGDRHYATDVLVGALIGFGVGYGLPMLLHYGSSAQASSAANAMQPLDRVVPLGPVISGSF